MASVQNATTQHNNVLELFVTYWRKCGLDKPKKMYFSLTFNRAHYVFTFMARPSLKYNM